MVHLSFLQAPRLLLKLFFENEQLYAKLLVGLIPAKYTPRCVNPCQPVFIRVRIAIQGHEDSRLVKTRPVALKIWSWPFFNEQDQNVKL